MNGNGEPPVDVEAFRATMREGGIEEVVEPTLDLELFERETPIVFQRIRDAVSEQDSRGISAGAHLLKSPSANIRAHVLSELLCRLERAGGAGDLDQVTELMPSVETEYASVMVFLAGIATS